MREVPERIERLPEQYFTALLARVAAAAAQGGEPLVDLGRGNPEVGPPAHVVHALTECAERHDVHGYAPFAGLPALKEAIAKRYGELYDVHLDPAREVAVLPGTKTGLMEFALCAVESGGTIVLPDPGLSRLLLRRRARRCEAHAVLRLRGRRRRDVPQLPVESHRSRRPGRAVRRGDRMGRPDGRVDRSTTSPTATSSSTAGARRAFSRSSTRSASASNCSACRRPTGWRVGDSGSRSATRRLVRRIELLQDHAFAGIFRPVQEAGIAALTGPQDSVEERRATYERRRDRALVALEGIDARSEGTFFVWFRPPNGLTVDRLLMEHRVAVAPGEGFGARGAGWARLSLAVPDEILDRGLERLRAAFA